MRSYRREQGNIGSLPWGVGDLWLGGLGQDVRCQARAPTGRASAPASAGNQQRGSRATTTWVQEVFYFKRVGIALQPDLVVLTYVWNDLEELNPEWDL